MSVYFEKQPNGLILSGNECKVKLAATSVYASEQSIGAWAYFNNRIFIEPLPFTITIDGLVFSFNNTILGGFDYLELYLEALAAEMNKNLKFAAYAYAQLGYGSKAGSCIVILPVVDNIKSIQVGFMGNDVDIVNVPASIAPLKENHYLGLKLYSLEKLIDLSSTYLVTQTNNFTGLSVRKKLNASLEMPSYSETVVVGNYENVSTNGYMDVDIREFIQTTKKGHYNISDEYVMGHTVLDKIIMVGYETYVGGSSSVDSAMFYVLQGFLPKYAEIEFTDKYSSFSDYMLRNKKFLSFQPVEKETDIYAIEHVNFYNFFGKPAARFMVKVYYSDNTNETTELAYQAINTESVYSISIGVLHNLPLQAGKKPIKYDVWLEYQDLRITEIRTYIVSYKYQSQARYFIYKNTLGVYETLRTTGVFKKTVPVNKEIVEFNENEDLQVDMSYDMQMQGSTGNILSKWSAAYIDMFSSDDVRLLVDGSTIPVTIHAGTFEKSTDMEHILDIPFTISMNEFREKLTEDFSNGDIILPITGDFAGDFSEDFN